MLDARLTRPVKMHERVPYLQNPAPSRFLWAVSVGLVDRLVRHLHLRPVRERSGEVVADLFRTPILHQPLLNRAGKLRRVEPPRFGTLGPALAPFLCCVGAVGAGFLAAVSGQLPRNGRWCPTELPGDLPDTGTVDSQISDPEPNRLGPDTCRKMAVWGRVCDRRLL